MNWKYVSYSASSGIAVTALSFLMYKQVGALFLWPGFFMEVMINALMLSLSTLTIGIYPRERTWFLIQYSTHSSYSYS